MLDAWISEFKNVTPCPSGLKVAPWMMGIFQDTFQEQFFSQSLFCSLTSLPIVSTCTTLPLFLISKIYVTISFYQNLPREIKRKLGIGRFGKGSMCDPSSACYRPLDQSHIYKRHNVPSSCLLSLVHCNPFGRATSYERSSDSGVTMITNRSPLSWRS